MQIRGVSSHLFDTEQQQTLDERIEEEEGDYTQSLVEMAQEDHYSILNDFSLNLLDEREEEEDSPYTMLEPSVYEQAPEESQITIIPDTTSLREEIGYVATIIKDFVKELPTIYKDPLKEPLPGGSPTCAMAQNYMQSLKQKMMMLGLQEAKRQHHYSLS